MIFLKRGLRPLLTIVIVYVLATALQMGAGYAPGDGLLALAKLLAALLAAALVGCWAALALSPNGKETIQKMVVQQKNPIRHPYVFRTSFNFFAVVLVLFATTVLWYPLLLGNEAT